MSNQQILKFSDYKKQIMMKKLYTFIIMIYISICNVSDVFASKTVKKKNYNEIQIFFTPSLECETNIIEKLNKSNKIDIAVYSITNPRITDAIISAYERGAIVRVITDRTQAKGKKSLVETIKEAGIPVLMNIKHRIEHNKFAVFDDVYVVSGSYNWTTNASMYNSENCIFFKQPNKEYSHRFEQLWNIYNNN